MNPSIRGNPHIREPERESWPNATSAGDSADSRAVLADAQPATIVEARQQRHQAGAIWRPERTSPRRSHRGADGVERSMPRAHGPKPRTRQRGQTAPRGEPPAAIARWPRASNVLPVASRPARAHTYLASDDERRRLERDLHDGVQNELVSLIVKLQLAEEDHHTPPELAGTLSALAAHAEAALDSVREIAHGIYPSSLAAFGVERAIRAQAARASMDVRLKGPRLAAPKRPRPPCTSPAWRRSRTSQNTPAAPHT